jgi:Fe-S-cluster-containing hydrogenase component 2
LARQIKRSPVPDNLARTLESRFDSPVWGEVARQCVGCSICAYVCPSCSCFDVQHEGNAWGGREFRSWDACTYALFTLHASGHNPRGDEGARYRQRLLHKFAYLAPDDEDVTRCVGCGRCIALCPVGIDIHAAVERIAAGEANDRE